MSLSGFHTKKTPASPLSLLQGIRNKWLIVAIIFACSLVIKPEICRSQSEEKPATLNDTIKKKEHSPKRASIYSLVLPGLGQAYNHKYWKIPIVYAGFGTMAYFITFNTRNYREFRDAYAYSTSTTKTPTVSEIAGVYTSNPSHFMPLPEAVSPPNDLSSKYSSDQLLVGREYYRRNLEVSYIVTGVWYILTVVDATVDAHFFNYNINDDLSLNVNPWMTPPSPFQKTGGGLMLTLKF